LTEGIMQRVPRSRPLAVVRWLLLALALTAGAAMLMACEPTGEEAGGTATPGTPAVTGTVEFIDFIDATGGPRNNVRVENTINGRFMARSSVDLKRINGPNVVPVNIAEARASCTGCQTIALALQVILYKQGANNVSPENYAVAQNVQCTRCVTVARAIQYVIPVEDPKKVPPDVDRLVRDLDRELRYFERFDNVRDIDAAEAERRLNTILSQYESLKAYLKDFRDEKQSGETPTPTATTPSATATPTPTPTSTPNSTPTAAGQ
jgi:putative peptide zinc metalloprotease protein